MNRCAICGKELTLTTECVYCTECQNLYQTFCPEHYLNSISIKPDLCVNDVPILNELIIIHGMMEDGEAKTRLCNIIERLKEVSK